MEALFPITQAGKKVSGSHLSDSQNVHSEHFKKCLMSMAVYSDPVYDLPLDLRFKNAGLRVDGSVTPPRILN